MDLNEWSRVFYIQSKTIRKNKLKYSDTKDMVRIGTKTNLKQLNKLKV